RFRNSEKSTSTRPASWVKREILVSFSRASLRSRGETSTFFPRTTMSISGRPSYAGPVGTARGDPAGLGSARGGDGHHPCRAMSAERVGGGCERGARRRDVVDQQHAR